MPRTVLHELAESDKAAQKLSQPHPTRIVLVSNGDGDWIWSAHDLGRCVGSGKASDCIEGTRLAVHALVLWNPPADDYVERFSDG